MLKDKVIELDNKAGYYIFEEINYLNRKFVLASSCNLDKDEISDEFVIKEIIVEGDNIITKDVEDEAEFEAVSILLLDQANHSN